MFKPYLYCIGHYFYSKVKIILFLTLFLMLYPQIVNSNPANNTPIRILLQWIPQAQFAGYIMAVEKGFFREEGLPEVELVWSNLGESALQRLVAGEVDFAGAWLSAGLQRWEEGLPIVNILQIMHKPSSLIVAHKSKNIKTIEDLNGKTILTWGGDFKLEFDMFLKLNNITVANIYPLSISLAPFLYGFVDAIQAMEYNEYNRLLERGIKESEIIVFPFSEYKINLVGDGLYTTVKFLEYKKSTVKAVCKAVMRGWEYAFANETETIAAVLKVSDQYNVRSSSSFQIKMLRIIHKLMLNDQNKLSPILAYDDFEHGKQLVIEAGLNIHDLKYEVFFQQP